ncbi:hypothetical protein DFR52_101759 [Hoeflea marina]|uniref:Uncharacterized protein n=1 Tax=Hoeflea marina TaxID=274592 RepID=A0A317PSD1_9HYPH|nr:hypothetical protein [Hoeflea marina]PWW04069.1 hypothetical protein DFR52_101759 [Hoeflea marina]
MIKRRSLEVVPDAVDHGTGEDGGPQDVDPRDGRSIGVDEGLGERDPQMGQELDCRCVGRRKKSEKSRRFPYHRVRLTCGTRFPEINAEMREEFHVRGIIDADASRRNRQEYNRV